MIDRFELFSSLIASIYKDIIKIERNIMTQYGLKGPHSQCLVAMRQYPDGITASELCEVCGKDKAAISRAVSGLESAGLIYRDLAGDNIYRAPLKLTEKGSDISSKLCGAAKAAVIMAGKGLSEENRKIFYDSLSLIASNLQSISDAPFSTFSPKKA